MPHQSDAPVGVNSLYRSTNSRTANAIFVDSSFFIDSNKSDHGTSHSHDPGGWETSRVADGSRRLVDSTAVGSLHGTGDRLGRDGTETIDNRHTRDPAPSLPQVSTQKLRIWSVNARKLLRRRAEIEARLRNSADDIVCIQETWLSDDVEAVSLGGYFMVGRLDRADGPKKGYGGLQSLHALHCLALLSWNTQTQANAHGPSCIRTLVHCLWEIGTGPLTTTVNRSGVSTRSCAGSKQMWWGQSFSEI